jgi:hypothetical protein
MVAFLLDGGRAIPTAGIAVNASVTRRGNAAPRWAEWPTERLLDLRFKDLGLSVAGTWLERCVARLYRELADKGLGLRPHVWLAEEWFSPTGVPGVALPFYLAHSRLIRLERRMMLEAEGASRDECMKLLRHEAGHAVQHAYRVERKRRWQRAFGRSSDPYPEYYRPNPASRRFVQHLDGWYAQSHPDEDFAETFAVWLRPRSGWRRRYAAWPKALAKLEVVDELMGELAGTPPVVRRRARPHAIERLDKTLREHYRDKQERYAGEYSQAYDEDLRRVFGAGEAGNRHPSAAAFIRRHRREMVELVCAFSGEYQFTVDQLLKEMTVRCTQLRLRSSKTPERQKLDFAVFLAVQTATTLHRGPGWHPL